MTAADKLSGAKCRKKQEYNFVAKSHDRQEHGI